MEEEPVPLLIYGESGTTLLVSVPRDLRETLQVGPTLELICVMLDGDGTLPGIRPHGVGLKTLEGVVLPRDGSIPYYVGELCLYSTKGEEQEAGDDGEPEKKRPATSSRRDRYVPQDVPSTCRVCYKNQVLEVPFGKADGDAILVWIAQTYHCNVTQLLYVLRETEHYDVLVTDRPLPLPPVSAAAARERSVAHVDAGDRGYLNIPFYGTSTTRRDVLTEACRRLSLNPDNYILEEHVGQRVADGEFVTLKEWDEEEEAAAAVVVPRKRPAEETTSQGVLPLARQQQQQHQAQDTFLVHFWLPTRQRYSIVVSSLSFVPRQVLTEVLHLDPEHHGLQSPNMGVLAMDQTYYFSSGCQLTVIERQTRS